MASWMDEAEEITPKKKKTSSWMDSAEEITKEDSGLLEQAGSGLLKGLSYVGEKVDRYANAPIRRFVSDIQQGESLSSAGKSALQQFGEPTEIDLIDKTGKPTGKTIPTVQSWKDIYANAGLSEKPLSEYLPESFYQNPDEVDLSKFDLRPVRGGFLDPSPAGAAGLITGLGTDLTGAYLKGAGAIAKGVSKIPKDAKSMAIAAENITTAPKTEQVPKSFAEMEKKLTQVGKLEQELPSFERLAEIEKNLPDLEFKPTGLHKELLKSKSNLDSLRAKYQELPSKERDLLDRYNQSMKSEIQEKLAGTARELNPNPKDLVQAGDSFMSYVDDTYKANKENIAPMFEQIDRVVIPKQKHIPTLIDEIAVNNKNIANSLEITPEGSLAIKPFNAKMGISKKEYDGINTVIDAINTGSLDFKEMQNIREFLRKSIDPVNPKETAALIDLRKSLLNHMENLVQYKNPSLDVRGAFQQWAKNEKNLEDITDIIGGKVGGFEESLKADPSRVINKIFSNVKNTRAMQAKLPPEKFNELLGDYINDIYVKSFDTAKNQISSAKLAQSLKKAAPVLKEVAPDQFAKMIDLVDLAKIIPDMPSVNPSGTSKTAALLKAGKEATNFQFGSAANEIADTIKGLKTERESKKFIEGLLAGTPAQEKKRIVKGLLNSKSLGKTAEGLLKSSYIINQSEDNK